MFPKKTVSKEILYELNVFIVFILPYVIMSGRRTMYTLFYELSNEPIYYYNDYFI